MKIVITGQQGLGAALGSVYNDHDVTAVSKTTGHDIHEVRRWAHSFLDHDMIINCAYSGLAQIEVLQFFFQAWKDDPNRYIITIGSTVTDYSAMRPDMIEHYWPYRVHKQALLAAWRETCCHAVKSKLINPGPIDTAMTAQRHVIKMPSMELAQKIRDVIQDPWIRRVDLWQ